MASFVEAEFGTEVSQSASGVLVIKGRFGSEHIESLLRKYVEQYVTCRTCNCMDTTLTRDQQTRLVFLHCNICRSASSVGAIQKGFKATTKADRKNERAKG
jgi:translation initiation factor 2 subunit 2